MFSKKFILIQLLAVSVAACLLVFYIRSAQPALPVLGHVQDFHLTNSEGKEVSLKDLKGKVWVADFFFTTCGSICPMMGNHMKRIHQAFKPYGDVRLVSFSVNPENDNPEVLKQYAKKYNADTRQWIFLTGSREDMTKVAVESFKLGDIKEPIFHSSYFTLVDQEGNIRGYYDSSEPKNIDQIIKDLQKIL
jgi:protein SCO1/2